ncbi:hypothetical protein DFH11DRAFT_1730358 [Phellopilus nigrolimitatus]|nr:hypothetical protein DFH11DRAFT_1730358 [Phellopilus nigrolimitatus]
MSSFKAQASAEAFPTWVQHVPVPTQRDMMGAFKVEDGSVVTQPKRKKVPIIRSRLSDWQPMGTTEKDQSPTSVARARERANRWAHSPIASSVGSSPLSSISEEPFYETMTPDISAHRSMVPENTYHLTIQPPSDQPIPIQSGSVGEQSIPVWTPPAFSSSSTHWPSNNSNALGLSLTTPGLGYEVGMSVQSGGYIYQYSPHLSTPEAGGFAMDEVPQTRDAHASLFGLPPRFPFSKAFPFSGEEALMMTNPPSPVTPSVIMPPDPQPTGAQQPTIRYEGEHYVLRTPAKRGGKAGPRLLAELEMFDGRLNTRNSDTRQNASLVEDYSALLVLVLVSVLENAQRTLSRDCIYQSLPSADRDEAKNREE